MSINEHDMENLPLDAWLGEFFDEVKKDIQHNEIKRGDSWKDISDDEIQIYLSKMIHMRLSPSYLGVREMPNVGGDWDSIVGYALIGWLKENRPELFRK